MAVPRPPDPLELARTGSAAYHVLSLLQVDDDIRRAAVHAVKAAAARLGIRAPEIIWVAERGEPGWLEAQAAGRLPRVARADADGFFLTQSPQTIYVKAALASPGRARRVALHELGHLQQHQAGVLSERSSAEEREQLERDADIFADAMLEQFGTEVFDV